MELFNATRDRCEGIELEAHNGRATMLHEQYRPRCWSDVVGQDKAIASARGLIVRGLGGRAIWISGKSGQGKTTIARLLAAELADSCNVDELDASELNPARLAVIERGCRCRAIGQKTGRAFLVNEAHGLSRAAVRQLLVILERIPSHVVWIFTTTVAGQQLLLDGTDDGGPLLSRCNRIELAKNPGAKVLAARVRDIAIAAGLDGQPLAKYVDLIDACKGNMRAALCEVESGAMLA